MFEGLKAYRKSDGGIQLFRPELNALRMQMGAKRLCMPAPSVEQFVDAAKQIVIANKRWVRLESVCYGLYNTFSILLDWESAFCVPMRSIGTYGLYK